MNSLIPEVSDRARVGMVCMCLGMFFYALGTLLFLDRKLLSLGNLLFLTGFTLLSGPLATLKFFGFAGDAWKERWQKRWRGLITFIGGIVLVLAGYTFLGLFCEVFGFISLYGSLFPVALAFLRRLPLVGPVLSLPGVAVVADKLAGKTNESMV